jgi:uncharacterized membrane protein
LNKKELRYATPENQIKSIANNSMEKNSPKYNREIKGDTVRIVIRIDHGACASEMSRAFFSVFFTVFSKVDCKVKEY